MEPMSLRRPGNLGVDIEALCGEKKVCGKCKVRIEEGFFEKFGIHSSRSHVSEWQEEEDKFVTPGAERRKAFAWPAWQRSTETCWYSSLKKPGPESRSSAKRPETSTSTGIPR